MNLNLVQGQCKPNAESSLYAEVQPVLAISTAKLGVITHQNKKNGNARLALACTLFTLFVKVTKKESNHLLSSYSPISSHYFLYLVLWFYFSAVVLPIIRFFSEFYMIALGPLQMLNRIVLVYLPS